MPFKKIDAQAIVNEKRKDKEFNEHYQEVQKEYELIRQVVEARKAQGLTQKSLANIVGVSQQEISRLECEKHIPNLSSFIKILEAVGLEIKLEKKEIAHH
jgi:DNA-binding XRE family transcriptional regulator